MCSSAIYWSGNRHVVYALRSDTLTAMVRDVAGVSQLALSCGEVFARGGRGVVVSGPHLTEQAAEVHEGFWALRGEFACSPRREFVSCRSVATNGQVACDVLRRPARDLGDLAPRRPHEEIHFEFAIPALLLALLGALAAGYLCSAGCTLRRRRRMRSAPAGHPGGRTAREIRARSARPGRDRSEPPSTCPRRPGR
jgi:hypothetical protein